MTFRAFAPLALAALVAAAPPAAYGGVADAFGDPVFLGDLVPGEDPSFPTNFIRVGERALFEADGSDGSVGQVWSTDGTPAGTVRLSPPGTDAGSFRAWSSPDSDIAYFTLFDLENRPSVWVTDGTPAGTAEVADGLAIDGSGIFGPDGRFYFSGSAGEGEERDVEPWVSDGTPEGSFRLLDTIPGPDPFGVADLVVFDGEVYFRTGERASGRPVIWKTDGTTAGTVVAIAPEGDFRLFADVVVAGSSLHLTGLDGLGFISVWRSDGTTAGTVKLAELAASDFESGPVGARFLADLSEGDGERTVWAIDGFPAPTELWGVDGTPGAARELGTFVGTIFQPVVIEGRAYFVADDEALGSELFRTDGTVAGTGPVVDLCPGPCNGSAGGPAVRFADHVLMVGTDGAGTGLELYASDGTAAGTRRVADICPGACGSEAFVQSGIDLGGVFVFPARSAQGAPRQLWATDLTAAGTVELTDFDGGALATLGRSARAVLFMADDGVHGFEPWAIPFAGPGDAPFPPPGPWHTGPGLPGFEVKARITAGDRVIPTAVEPECLAETLCLSGALPGRSEVFVRVPGPKPNGFLWPTLVKLTTSEVEVWIRQLGTGEIRFYRLPGARPGFDELPGLFDRDGFRP